MADLWLEKLQQREQVERLLETFAIRSGLVPEGAYRIRDRQALSDELQQILTETTAHVWVCFADGTQAWLFTGRVGLVLSHQHNAPVLQVNSYNEQGILVDIGTWTVGHDGRWHRYED